MKAAMGTTDMRAQVVDPAAGDPLSGWRWLVDGEPTPVLVTALGDVFVRTSSGEIWFLDTYRGLYELAARDDIAWRIALQDSSRRDEWFFPGLVASLRERDLCLVSGQCYSPVLAPVVGGSMDPDNFECSPWLLHISLAGQLHEQSRTLPEGTPVKAFVDRDAAQQGVAADGASRRR
jgi:hypothetical protein